MKTETLEQYLARGGQITRLPRGYARGYYSSLFGIVHQEHSDPNLVLQRFWLSGDEGLIRTQRLTGLTVDEIVEITGVFGSNSKRQGEIKGELVEYRSGQVILKHYGTDDILWVK